MKPSTSGKTENQQEISLRPNAGVVPTGKSPTEGGAKTWGNKVNPAQSSGKLIKSHHYYFRMFICD